MTSFFDALIPVADALDSLQVPYYIGGSVAAIAHGVPRTTLDVDLIAELQSSQVIPFVNQIQPDYFVQVDDILDAIRTRGSFNLIHLGSMIKVDVFLPPRRPFDKSKALRVQRGLITSTSQRMFNLTSPEDIVLQKLEWYNQGGRVSNHQWRDAQGVLKVQGVALDLAYLHHWAAELAIDDLLEQALQDSGNVH